MWFITALTTLEISGIENGMGTKTTDVTSGSEMQRSPFVFPSTWSFAALCDPHFDTALGTRIYSSTTNRFRDCMLTHHRYFLDGADENMNQTNETRVIILQRSPKTVFKYHADDGFRATHCCCSSSAQVATGFQQTCLQDPELRRLSEPSWTLMPSKQHQPPRSWGLSSTIHSCESWRWRLSCTRLLAWGL